MTDRNKLEKIARLIRYYSVATTSKAGSGHATSSLSATDLMTGLVFGGTFRYEVGNPANPNNDRLIFSKGHASPLFYALWAVAGAATEEEIMTLREFGSPFEGHPMPAFPYVEAATGSLGQGLNIGLGIALNAKYLDKLPYRTYVLLGDSEMAEGSQWEAVQLAAHYKLDNLIGVLDVNRLGQRGQTMLGRDPEAYKRRLESFGWNTLTLDGHNMEEIIAAFEKVPENKDAPLMIIGATVKGKGAPTVEDQNGYHGKALSGEDYEETIKAIGDVDKGLRGEITMPEGAAQPTLEPKGIAEPGYALGKEVATRAAYGTALKRIYPAWPDIVALDGEVSNSTMAETFKNEYPERFFEMFVAEQNMVGAGIGLSTRGKLPFISSFAAFHTRAFDFIRMGQYSDANLKFCGSHAGVSIGEDGASQMGLEDIAMFRAMMDSVVLYPSDAVSTERLVETMAGHRGISYIRTTRGKTPVIYTNDEKFEIGGSKVLKRSDSDKATVIGAGITLHEALEAQCDLEKEGIMVRVIDLYSIKPVDVETLKAAARETGTIITVEDHYPEGGIGEAVRTALDCEGGVRVHSLAVTKKPKSGPPDKLLDFEGISKKAIVEKVKEVL